MKEKQSNWGYHLDPKTKRFAKWPKKAKKQEDFYWFDILLAMLIGVFLGIVGEAAWLAWDTLSGTFYNF